MSVDWQGLYEAARAAAGLSRMALRDHLYARHYGRPRALALAPGRARPVDRDPALVGQLATVAAPYSTWETGWRLVERGADFVFIQDATLTLAVRDPARLAPADARAGEPVALRLPCAREGLSVGFFTVVGPAGPGRGGLRLYVDLVPAHAADWLAALMAGLGPTVPYMAKVATTPAGLARADAAVVYADEATYPTVRDRLLGLAHAHSDRLRGTTPLFTRALAPGLAAAEGPPPETGESFGQHRCGLVADATLARPGVAFEPWLAEVARRFEAAGTSLAAPYTHALPADFFAT